MTYALEYLILLTTPSLKQSMSEFETIEDTTCRDWFRRFKNNDFELEDKERSGAPKKFQDKELEQLLDVVIQLSAAELFEKSIGICELEIDKSAKKAITIEPHVKLTFRMIDESSSGLSARLSSLGSQ
ncbi:MOS1T transposase, partial [Pseudoatta argentina]